MGRRGGNKTVKNILKWNRTNGKGRERKKGWKGGKRKRDGVK